MQARLLPMARALMVTTLMLCASAIPAKTKQPPQGLREAYLARVQQQPATQTDTRTLGSLWTPGAPLGQLASDYKAHGLNDTITIVVAEVTSAQSSGNLNSQRTFATESAITGLLAQISTKG